MTHQQPNARLQWQQSLGWAQACLSCKWERRGGDGWGYNRLAQGGSGERPLQTQSQGPIA